MKINIEFIFNSFTKKYENITVEKAAHLLDEVVRKRSKKHRIDMELFKNNTLWSLEHLTDRGIIFTPYLDMNFATKITMVG